MRLSLSGLRARIRSRVRPLIGAVWFAALPASAAELRLAFSANPGSLPVVVAQAQGYFEAEGLAVRPVPCAVGRDCLRLLLAGEADFATAADLPLMLAAFAGERFSIVATLNTNRSDTKVIARASSGIRASADLSGRRVATVFGTTAQYALESLLLFDGVRSSTVTKVDLPVAALRPALLGRQVDAVAIFEPQASEIVAALAPDAVVIPTGRTYTQTWNLVARDSAASAVRRPAASGPVASDLRRPMLRALLRASDWIVRHPRQARDLLQRRSGLSAELVEASWGSLGYDLSLKQSLIVTLEGQARWAMRERIVRAPLPNFLEFIDTSVLRSLRPLAVTMAQ